MRHCALVLTSLIVLLPGCLNEVLDVGMLPSTGDDSGDGSDGAESDDGESASGTSDGGSTDDGEQETGSEDSGDSGDSGEELFPECEPPAEEISTFSLPYTYDDAFLGNRRIFDCTVSSIALPTVTLDCVQDEEPAELMLTLAGIEAVPLVVDQAVVVDELLNTGIEHGFIGAAQMVGIRDEGGELLMASANTAVFGFSAPFDVMPWEPELTLGAVDGLCPIDEGSGLDCSFEERSAVEVSDGADSVVVLDSHEAEALGYEIYVAEAFKNNEPCLDNEHGRYQVLVIKQP